MASSTHGTKPHSHGMQSLALKQSSGDDMKIAVYTIALNEEQFVERWAESAREADYLLIADTGSTDKTLSLAYENKIHTISIHIEPWRFDDARNAALAALPADIDFAIALDMDEVLQPGWREALESVAENVTRPRYKYTWSWKADGTPGLVYGGDKIHQRHGYRWTHPVHEVLSAQIEEVQQWIDLEIHHHPDDSKSRSQYFPLLEKAVAESPNDDRNVFYFARELFFHDHKERAIALFKRHLSMPSATWNAERAASMRYLAKLETHLTESWLLRAIAEAPTHREARVELAQFYHDNARWLDCYAMAKSALAITDQPLEYLCEPDAWGYLPHDLIALSSWWMGKQGEALEQGRKACELSPADERLAKNLHFYERGTDEQLGVSA